MYFDYAASINNVTFDVTDLGSPLCMFLVWPQILGRPWNIGINHGFPCINICQVTREVLKTEVEEVLNCSRGTGQMLRH